MIPYQSWAHHKMTLWQTFIFHSNDMSSLSHLRQNYKLFNCTATVPCTEPLYLIWNIPTWPLWYIWGTFDEIYPAFLCDRCKWSLSHLNKEVQTMHMLYRHWFLSVGKYFYLPILTFQAFQMQHFPSLFNGMSLRQDYRLLTVCFVGEQTCQRLLTLFHS